MRHLPPSVLGRIAPLPELTEDLFLIMLTRAEFDIFGICVDTFIPLYRLLLQVANTLFESGSRSVNVQRLTVPQIVESLSRYSSQLNSDASENRMDSGVVRWLFKLFHQIRNHSL